MEVSPENEAKARAFMDWYGANMNSLRYYVQGSGIAYDEDLFTDAFLRAYDAISRRGTEVRSYTGYFLQTYRSAFLDSKKKPTTSEPLTADLPAPESDTPGEEAVEVTAEVLEYVRRNYDEFDVSLFEVYAGLSPDISYRRMASMLGVPASKIWPAMSKIKKDVYDFLLSKAVDF